MLGASLILVGASMQTAYAKSLPQATSLASAGANKKHKTKPASTKPRHRLRASKVRKTAAVKRPVTRRPQRSRTTLALPAASAHSLRAPVLSTSAALLLDASTDQVLFAKNADTIKPIASITKLMTALVVMQSGQPMDEMLSISSLDIDTEKHSRSRLAVGTHLTRADLLHLALMSSENRAANALGRHHPGGLRAFVLAMNQQAQTLRMPSTTFVDPTGLSHDNTSTPSDLAKLVLAANQNESIRQWSTATEHHVMSAGRALAFVSSNALVRSGSWEIGVQKTGYISEAGRCVVMVTTLAGREVIMVLLDAPSPVSRWNDARKLRAYAQAQPLMNATMPSPILRAAGTKLFDNYH